MKKIISEMSSWVLKHNCYDKITGALENGSTTLLELLMFNSQTYPNEQMLGAINKSLEVEYISYKNVDNCAKKISNYLSSITKQGEIVGIASANRPEWIMAEFACYYSNCVNSPLYTTFKEEALSYILATTQMRVLIAAPSFARVVIERVYEFIPADLIKLEYIILMENDKAVIELCKKKGLKVISMSDILFGDMKKYDSFYYNDNNTICAKATRYFEEYSKNEIKLVDQKRGLPKSEDLATICFTSGTTGVPKGVQLTHLNFISQIESFHLGMQEGSIFNLSDETVYLSFLPLSHVFEKVVFCVCISLRTKVVFFRGDRTLIGEDIKLVKPSFIAAVPKVLQLFYQKIEDKVATKRFYERWLYKIAVASKIFLQKKGFKSFGLLDRVVFKKVTIEFGGKLNDCLVGGASVDPYLIQYLQAVLGASFFQGYGQTEGLGANILASKNMNDAASVGFAFPSTRIKLVSISDNSPEKAIYFKGYSITKGYFQPSDEILDKLLSTKKISFNVDSIRESPFDENGWLSTGDVALYENGKIYIIGRNKDLVKLNNGEYISPENIENRLRETSFIKDVFIMKIRNTDKFVALVSVSSEDVSLKRVAAYLRNSITSLKDEGAIPKCVNVSNFAIVNQCFTEIDEGALITPTFKKKRFIFAKKFEKEMDNAYSINDILNSRENSLNGDYDKESKSE